MCMLILSDFFGQNFLPVSQKTPIRTSNVEIDACSHGISRYQNAEYVKTRAHSSVVENLECVRLLSTFFLSL